MGKMMGAAELTKSPGDKRAREGSISRLTGIFQGAGLVGLGEAFWTASYYVTSLIIARQWGASAFGIYSLSFTIGRFLSFVTKLGVDSGLVRYIPLYRSRGDVARLKGIILFGTRSVLLVSLAVGLVLFLMADFVSIKIFRKAQLCPALEYSAVFLTFMALQEVFAKALQGLQNAKHSVISCKVIQPFVMVTLTLVAGRFNGGISGTYLALLISFAASLAISACWLLKNTPYLLERSVLPFYEKREWLGFSLPLLFNGVLMYVLYWLDTWVLGYFGSAKDVGVYTAVLRVAYIVYLPLTAYSFLFVPTVSELWERDRYRAEQILTAVSRWVFSASFPCFLIICSFPEEFLSLFGTEFAVGKGVLAMLCLGQLAAALGSPVGFLLIAAGKPQVILLNTVLLALLNLTLDFVFIPKWSLVGAAIASMTVNGLSMFLRLSEGLYLLRVNPFQKSYWKPALAALLSIAITFGVVLRLTPYAPVASLLVLLVGYVALYLCFLLIFRLDQQDIAVLQTLLYFLRRA